MVERHDGATNLPGVPREVFLEEVCIGQSRARRMRWGHVRVRKKLVERSDGRGARME